MTAEWVMATMAFAGAFLGAFAATRYWLSNTYSMAKIAELKGNLAYEAYERTRADIDKLRAQNSRQNSPT